MYRLGRILSHITQGMTVIGGLAVALMMLHITLNVAGRYLLNAPVPGTITMVAYYYMIIAGFVPLAFSEQKDAHISVEVVTERLPPWIQRHLAGWTLLASATIFALLAVRTWIEALSKHAIGASIVQGTTSIPVWPTYYVLPAGFALMVLVLLYKFVVYLFDLRSGLDETRATPDELDTGD